MNILKDNFGRKFPYIRLSISDVCNFKCGYCLPNGYKIDKSDNRTFITKEEIGRLAKALSELGVSKIRITGGEPTVRKDFLDIIKIIKKNSGIKKTVITTNGYQLNRIADDLNDNDWLIQTFGKDAGPSKNYINPEYKGKFGVIAPYSKDFCKSCNRLRITAVSYTHLTLPTILLV